MLKDTNSLDWAQLISTNLSYLEVVRADRIHKMHVFYYLAIIYEYKLSNFGNFSLRLGFFFIKIGKNTYFLPLGIGQIM